MIQIPQATSSDITISHALLQTSPTEISDSDRDYMKPCLNTFGLTATEGTEEEELTVTMNVCLIREESDILPDRERSDSPSDDSSDTDQSL